MLYVPLGYWLQRLLFRWHQLNGPVVNGVTLVLVVVAAMLLNVSFVNAFNAVTTVLFDATVTDGSFTAFGLFTTTVAVAVSQFAGLTFNPVDGLVSLVGDVVRTTWCIGCNGYIPLASMLNGPVVNGVTLVLVVVAAMLLTYHLQRINAVTFYRIV
jgi:hypothetical protein